MSEFVNVAVDAMGGDNAPGEVVKGAIEAIQESNKIKVFLVGQKACQEMIAAQGSRGTVRSVRWKL